MLSVLKTILTRLEKIEKQLGNKEENRPIDSHPQRQPTPGSEELVNIQTEAKQILINAKDEAFRIKKEAEEEVRRDRLLKQKGAGRPPGRPPSFSAAR